MQNPESFSPQISEESDDHDSTRERAAETKKVNIKPPQKGNDSQKPKKKQNTIFTDPAVLFSSKD